MEESSESFFKNLYSSATDNSIFFIDENYDPEFIGRVISGTANSARLLNRQYGYVIWGVNKDTRRLCGTARNISNIMVGKLEFKHWLNEHLSTNTTVEFKTTVVDGYNICYLKVSPAVNTPVIFNGIPYYSDNNEIIKLLDKPQVVSKLWNILSNKDLENNLVINNLDLEKALSFLSFGTFFDLKKINQPYDLKIASRHLIEDQIIVKQDNSLYGITNMGALLFAKNLNSFPTLSHKLTSIVIYKGNSRDYIKRIINITQGYALSFEMIFNILKTIIPGYVSFEDNILTENSEIPLNVVKEIIIYSLANQDISREDSGLIIEIFKDKISFLSPGEPLFDTFEILKRKQCRNNKLKTKLKQYFHDLEPDADFIQIIDTCEKKRILPPFIQVTDGYTKVTLKRLNKIEELSLEEREWLCYTHAYLYSLKGESISNNSLKSRLNEGIASPSTISRIIKDCLNKGLIRAVDPNTAPRYMKYVLNEAIQNDHASS